MADQVLGKRARSTSPANGTTSDQPDAKRANGSSAGDEKVDAPTEVVNGGMEDIAEEDDDDDDIGPMPDMPGDGADDAVKGKKKSKKAGECCVL
jgi:hypothetical protein